MLQRPVGEAGEQRIGIRPQRLPFGGGEAGRRLVPHQPLDHGPDDGIGDRLVDEIMPALQTHIGQRRMRAVEHPQLGGLIGRDIGDELRAADFPTRTVAREIILDHPLAIGLGDDGRFVAHS